MTDCELLEAAAKAAGIEGRWMTKGDGDLWLFRNDFSDLWNPLTDDGDALRLAVKLGMNVHVVVADGTFVSRYEDEPVIAEKRGSDPYAATRRAIVRAAAEIGRQVRLPQDATPA